jgi:hypothetical protein
MLEGKKKKLYCTCFKIEMGGMQALVMQAATGEVRFGMGNDF